MKKAKLAKRAAGKAPAWLRDIAASKATKKKTGRSKGRSLGTFGAASPVRAIYSRGGADT